MVWRGLVLSDVVWPSVEVLGSLVIAAQVKKRERERERNMTARWGDIM